MTYEWAEGYKIRNQAAMHFLTFTVVGWIDIFSRQRYRDIIIQSFQYCRKQKGLKIGAYVIMSNHIHTIWTPSSPCLSAIVRDFKTFTSKAIIESIQSEPESRRDWLLQMFRRQDDQILANKAFKVWTGNNHPEEIFSERFMKTKLMYTHQNPVKAGWVDDPTHYKYSSAANYAGQKGVMDIDYLF